MTCICGYEYLEKWHTEDGNGVGDEKFITLEFTEEIKIENRNFDGYRGYRKIEVDIYACPKCGTLKIDL